MEDFDVVVQGFPSTMAQKKIELFIKRRFRKEFEVKKIGEGRVGIRICNAKDVPAFPHHSMTEVQFGSQSYPLTYLKSPTEITDLSEFLPKDRHHREDLEQLPVAASSKWNDNAAGTTGLKDAVESTLENIKTCTELKIAEVPIDEDELRTLRLCGILEDLEKNFRNASFKISSDRNSLTVIAPDADLPMIQKKIWKNGIKERRIDDLNESVRRYLIGTAAVNGGKIQNEILAEDIKAEFVPNTTGVYIKSKCEEDHTKVADIIKRLTWVSNFDVAGPKAEVIEKEEWKEFVQKIAKENCAVYEKGCKSVDIVGLKNADADGILEKVRLFFEEHEIRIANVALTHCQAKFVLDYCEIFNTDNPKRKALKNVSQISKPGGTLRLEGTRKSIEEAQLEINQIVAGIVTEKHSRSNPAIKRYYLDPANQGEIENIRRATNCYIEANLPKLSETKGTKKAKLELAVIVPKTSLFSTQLGKCTLTICMVDIITHTADGIVNIVAHGHFTPVDEYDAAVDESLESFEIEQCVSRPAGTF